jgi:pimeloyl-ACP methyl ester carboxylesterase
VGKTIRRLLYAASGDVPGDPDPPLLVLPPGRGWLDEMPEPAALPAWLTSDDLEVFAAEFSRTGFRGGLNWYRCSDLSWELMGPWQGATVEPPALYVVGDRDLVMRFPGAKDALAGLQRFIPNLRRTLILPGCGHWTQQERPAEVNAALLELLDGL